MLNSATGRLSSRQVKGRDELNEKEDRTFPESSPKPARQTVRELFRERTLYFVAHCQREKILIFHHYRILLLGIFFQYLHSVATRVAYFLHVPREPLPDLGFAVLPALTRETQIVSEYMFFAYLGSTILFAFSPFLRMHQSSKKENRLYCVLMVSRFLCVCVLAQTLRIICFLVTTLPGPNYHCRPDSPDYNPPINVWDIMLRTEAFFSCGDLVFSSHTIFVMLCALTWYQYSGNKFIERFVFVLAFGFGCLVVSARKHYTLDVVVAMYTVPLLWIAYDRYFPDKIPPELLSEEDMAVYGEHSQAESIPMLQPLDNDAHDICNPGANGLGVRDRDRIDRDLSSTAAGTSRDQYEVHI